MKFHIAGLLLAAATASAGVLERQASSSSASASSATDGQNGQATTIPRPFTDNPGPLYVSPPSYPSPWGTGSGNWTSAYEKATAFVSQLTLLEKVNITTGVGWEGERCVGQTGSVPRLNLRSFCLQDSPLGVRDTDYNTAFPAGMTVAATWSRSLAYARGLAMGQEHFGKGVDAQLGPVCGPLGRVPEGGRGWEGFSPDPYLTGQLIAPTVQGIQAAGVIATTKHYIGNEQEHFRQNSEADGAPQYYNITEALSSNIDDATMHELYLWPFADAVRAGTAAIMCSYNQINNSYACQNSHTLNYLLKNELDYQGFVMSDWGAQHGGIASTLAGLDMTMPGDTAFSTGLSFWGGNLTISVLNGTVPEWRIDDMATRVMAAFYYVGRDIARPDINYDSWTLDTYAPEHFQVESPLTLVNEHVDVRDEHALVVREVGRQANVLLKNTDGALPLTGQERQTVLIGYDAGSNPWGANGCSDRGCDNGTLAMGWGSGTANFPYLVTPEEAIQNYVLTQGMGEVFAITGNYFVSQAVAAASQASVAIVFANSDSGEGYITVDNNTGDRNNLTLWGNADQLIANVTAVCNNTIVVMHTVGAVLIDAWYDNENVTGIIWSAPPGQESGNSLVDVLYGAYSPGGKLPFSMAKARSDYGADVLYEPNNGQFGPPQQDFTEGVFIDYRAIDKAGLTPIYEFGFGLSYTTFSFSDLVVTQVDYSPYVPNTGLTPAAPSLGTPDPNVADYLFPTSNFTEYPLYIYPYLNSTNLANASTDPDYGLPGFVPAGAQDGSPQPVLPAGGAPGGNAALYDVIYEVSATITNTGSVLGDEVPQLYVSLGGNQPKVMLRGFDRLTVPVGGTATFTTGLTRKDFSTWSSTDQDWVQTPCFTIYVGNSSRNLPLSALIGSGCGSSGGASSASASATAVSQISDGQPQAPTSPAVSQISDGQPQAPTMMVTTTMAVSQISDAQPQAPTSM